MSTPLSRITPFRNCKVGDEVKIVDCLTYNGHPILFLSDEIFTVYKVPTSLKEDIECVDDDSNIIKVRRDSECKIV